MKFLTDFSHFGTKLFKFCVHFFPFLTRVMQNLNVHVL